MTNTYIDNRNVFKIDPWVECTRWYNYLNTLEVKSFLALIDKPNLDSKPTLSVVWDAIAELYHICNETVALKAGVFI